MSTDAQYVRGLDREKRRPPIVRFEQRARFDQALTEKHGRSTFVDEDVVEITSPDGGVTLAKRVDEWFAEMDRDPVNWGAWAPSFKRMYDDWKRSRDVNAVQGTHIRNWPLLSPAQVETLLNAGFASIEAVAEMPDEVAATIDGGAYIRSKARFWLNSAEDIGAVAAEVARLTAENETLHSQVEELGRKLQELKAENERLTQHFTGKEGYDIIAGRVQPVGLRSVQAAQQQPSSPPTPPPQPQPKMPEGPKLMSVAQLQTLSMAELRSYAYEHDVKPHTSKEETIKRLVDAGAAVQA